MKNLKPNIFKCDQCGAICRAYELEWVDNEVWCFDCLYEQDQLRREEMEDEEIEP